MRNGFLDDLPDLGIRPVKRKKRKSAPEQEPGNVVVKYVRVKCPKCGGLRVPVYNSEHLPIRYHRCADCGFCFKSVEEPA